MAFRSREIGGETMRRQLKPVKRGVERSEYVRGGESKAARGGGKERRGDETKGATDSEWTGQGSVRQGVEPQRNARRSIRDADIEAGSVRWMNAGSW